MAQKEKILIPAKDTAVTVAEEIHDLFRLIQEERREDLFLDFLFAENVYKEPNRGTAPDNWRFRPEILTFILYVFCPHEEFLGRMLSPSRGKGISQAAVSRRLYRAIEEIAKRYGCPAPALGQELRDAKKRILNERRKRSE